MSNPSPLSYKISDIEQKIILVTGCSLNDICTMRSEIRSKIPNADQQLDTVVYIVNKIYERTWQCGESLELATTNVLSEV